MADSQFCLLDVLHPRPGWLTRHCHFLFPFGLPLHILSLGKLGPDSIVMAQGNDSHSVVAQMLGAAAVVMDEDWEEKLTSASPFIRVPLAQDTRAYILALKGCFYRFGSPISSWLEEEVVIRAGEDFSCVFSPEECERITRATKPMYEAAARHNSNSLLPDYVPNPAWRPFPGLRREQG
jgi:hypothetical protein